MDGKGFWVMFWEVFSSTVQGVWTGFAWPHAVLVITVIIVYKFKDELSTAISRLNKVGPVEFIHPPVPLDASAKAVLGAGVDEVAEHPVSGLKGIPLPPVAFPYTLSVSASNLDTEIAGLSREEQLPYLKERLAFCRVLYDFETLYIGIYGGQIELLNYLNQKTFNLAPRLELEGLWNSHKAKFHGQLDVWTLDNYMNFLTFNNLVSTGSAGYTLTTKGKEFLMWMIQTSKSPLKPW